MENLDKECDREERQRHRPDLKAGSNSWGQTGTNMAVGASRQPVHVDGAPHVVSLQGYKRCYTQHLPVHPSRQADRQRYPHSIRKQFNDKSLSYGFSLWPDSLCSCYIKRAIYL